MKDSYTRPESKLFLLYKQYVINGLEPPYSPLPKYQPSTLACLPFLQLSSRQESA